MLNRNRTSRTRISEIHRSNLRKSLEHRMEVARSQGNEALMRLLEAEADYLK
jgi:hypothetical protein